MSATENAAGIGAAKRGSGIGAVGRILLLWRGRTGWLAAGLVVALASVLAGLLLMEFAGMQLVRAGAAALVGMMALRIVGSSRVVLRYFDRLTTHAATFRALADLRVWFFRGLAARAAGGLGFRRAGDLLSRLVADVEALDGLYLRIIVPLAGACLAIPLLVWAIGHDTSKWWLAALIGVVVALSAFALPLLAARLAARTGAALAQHQSALRIALLDTLSGLREVRAFGAGPRMAAMVAEREAGLMNIQTRLADRAGMANAVSFLLAQSVLLLLLLLAASAGATLVALVFLSVAVFDAIAGLPRAGVLAGQIANAARRVLESATGAAPVPEPAHPAALPTASSVRFVGVRFRWAPDRPDVFDGMSLEIPAGSKVALLGPSGAGKSSLAALALKVAAPQAGRILLGGTDIAELRAVDVRTRISYLSQSTHLFADTIRANLLLGRPDADDAALWTALDAAAIGDFVRTLPDGLDSWLGEGGAGVSGGQGRRLALARALLSQAPILLLDEPCAGLDLETERAFLTTLNNATTGRTVILIAHRLTGVEKLDRIWRVSGGHAVAAAA